MGVGFRLGILRVRSSRTRHFATSSVLSRSPITRPHLSFDHPSHLSGSPVTSYSSGLSSFVHDPNKLLRSSAQVAFLVEVSKDNKPQAEADAAELRGDAGVSGFHSSPRRGYDPWHAAFAAQSQTRDTTYRAERRASPKPIVGLPRSAGRIVQCAFLIFYPHFRFCLGFFLVANYSRPASPRPASPRPRDF